MQARQENRTTLYMRYATAKAIGGGFGLLGGLLFGEILGPSRFLTVVLTLLAGIITGGVVQLWLDRRESCHGWLGCALAGVTAGLIAGAAVGGAGALLLAMAGGVSDAIGGSGLPLVMGLGLETAAISMVMGALTGWILGWRRSRP